MLRSVIRWDAPLLLLAATLHAQSAGAIEGTVTDETGAVVPAASITITGPSGPSRNLTTDADGHFAFPGLANGNYRLNAVRSGFDPFENGGIDVTAARTVTLNVTLALSATKQEVTVTSEQPEPVSVSPSSNAGAIVLRDTDLDALSDDSDELAEDLRALAGPSAGVGGSEFYVDGFSGGRLPPRSSIREVRINQNPFSSEYDRIGLGRIEVLTKPGSDNFHGMAAFKDSEAMLNSRNPYAVVKPPYYSRQLAADLGGPFNAKSSFALSYEHRQADDNVIVNATTLDSQMRIRPFTVALSDPQNHDFVNARVDQQVGDRFTIMGRYNWLQTSDGNAGVGGFLLASRAYTQAQSAHTAQLTATAVLGPNAITETRFQFIRNGNSQLGASLAPSINVLDAFESGGAQVGQSFANQNQWELQDSASLSYGAHMLRFGGRLRTASLYDNSPRNFGGTFVFGGGLGPALDANNQPLLDPSGGATLAPISSIERYRRTLLFEKMGLPFSTIQALGGGPSQFSMVVGQPASAVTEADAGLWLQDDWRVRPNLSVSLGLRWEAQNHINDWADFAPRLGIAWKPGNGSTVIRLGSGIFYDRFGENLVLQAMRFNGHTQREVIVQNPNFWPNIPSAAVINQLGLPQTIRQIAADTRAPELIQSAISVERPFFLGSVLSVNFQNTHGTHLLLSRNISAPLAGATLAPPALTNVYQYESSGILNRNQLSVSVNRRFQKQLSFFSNYTYSHTLSDTEGPDWFPANQYNLRGEYARAATDFRHSAVVGGSFLARWGVSLSPFLVARSGAPFNIVTGHDNNRDTLFSDRPSFATDLSKPGVVVTPFGVFDTRPAPGQALIPRNFGQGPAFCALNLRFSKTFGFGGESRATRVKGSSAGFGSGGGVKAFYDGLADRRYSLTLSVIVRNLFNTTNPGLPVGNLASPYFAQSNGLASSAGPGDLVYGDNRHVQLQLRLTF